MFDFDDFVEFWRRVIQPALCFLVGLLIVKLFR